MPEKTALAKFILSDRHKRGETQDEYAEHCGLSKEYLSKMEREIANPTLGTIQKVAASSGETVSQILTISFSQYDSNGGK